MLSTPAIRTIESIGPYQILEDLGPAPLGTAYYAVDSRSDREVILKVIPPSRPGAGQDDTPWEILLKETEALGRIYHPGIPALDEVMEEDGALLVAFAPVEGETLHELLVGGERPDRAQLIDWGIQLLEIVAEAHRAGILHRHINEEEVVVTPDGRLVLCGFGLTQLVFDPVFAMPPEQLVGEPVTERSDLYGVGLLLRRLAFTGALRGVVGGGRDPLLKVLARATFPEPSTRYASAAEMAEALRDAARAARPAPVAVPACPEPDPAERKAEVAVVGERPRPISRPSPAPPDTPGEDGSADRWRTLLLLAATVLLMLLVIATGWLLIGPAGDGTEAEEDATIEARPGDPPGRVAHSG
ncbi:MAG TPA: serine/threonine-protein kinase [Thermoanaerobaculia bacterium]|nr:serine/threonine-protein kinase [Thermoanaerobaculia bacterium]